MDTYNQLSASYISNCATRLPEYELIGSTLVMSSWPGKTGSMYKAIQLGYREIFLKTFGGAPMWTSAEIQKLEKAGIYLHKKKLIYDSPAFEYYAPLEGIDLSAFPINVNAIIAGYSIFGFPYFSREILRMFKQIYFHHHYVRIDTNKMTIRDGSWVCTIMPSSIYIDVDNIRFIYEDGSLMVTYQVYDTTIKIYYTETPHLVVNYRPINMRPPNDDELLKIPIAVIESFDPKNEFGLLRIFKSMITTSLICPTMNTNFKSYIAPIWSHY